MSNISQLPLICLNWRQIDENCLKHINPVIFEYFCSHRRWRIFVLKVSLVMYLRWLMSCRYAFAFYYLRCFGSIVHITYPWNQISMQYFSQRYLTTTGGRYFVLGCTLLARRNARSVFSQRRKLSPLTPAARASSDLVYDFIVFVSSNLR